jgi:hypothetical protein
MQFPNDECYQGVSGCSILAEVTLGFSSFDIVPSSAKAYFNALNMLRAKLERVNPQGARV